MTLRACSSARCARVRSPGDSVDHGALDVVRAEPELREQRARVDGGEAASCRRTPRAAAPRRARPAPGRSCRSPSCGRAPASRARAGARRGASSSSVDLPLPLRPVTASRSPGTRSRSIGPSVKSPRATTAPASRATGSRSGCPAVRPRLELPGLERLLGQLVAVEQPLRLAHLRHQGMRAAAVGHRLRRRGPGCGARRGARSARGGAPGPARTRVYAPARAASRAAAYSAPASRVLPDASASGLDLGDPRHRAVEEGAVVRDDDERGSVVAARNRSSRSSPSKSRSFVGSSRRSTS